MPDNQPTTRLVPTKSDAELARAYRDKLTPLLEQICEVVGAARHDGLIIGFNISPDQFGRVRIQAIDITKPL